MIFKQPFLNNFCDNSLTLLLYFFFSLLLLSKKKVEKGIITKAVYNWLSKYHLFELYAPTFFSSSEYYCHSCHTRIINLTRSKPFLKTKIPLHETLEVINWNSYNELISPMRFQVSHLLRNI